MKKCYSAVCGMVKDEPDLREWAAYHLAVGFDHVLVYDNDSRLPVSVVLGDLIERGLVTCLMVRGRFRQVTGAYVDALERARNHVRWMAFVDADEYIVPHGNLDMREFLTQSEAVGGIGVNWQIFGDGGHVSRPSGMMMERYLQRGPVKYSENRHVKAIIDPEATLWPCNPHCFYMRDRDQFVNGDGQPIRPDIRHQQAFQFPPAVSRIQINHYYTRSLEDFRNKQARGGGAGVRRRADEVFERIQRECNVVHDDRCLRFREKTKELLNA